MKYFPPEIQKKQENSQFYSFLRLPKPQRIIYLKVTDTYAILTVSFEKYFN